MSSENQNKVIVKNYQSGDILFNDGDVADSLYIIQKGQIRLYKPKGKGFIELGVLRAGEVIGEMAFFSDDEAGKRRSCSAAALTPLEIIEIPFSAFSKTMQSMNPWFNTIINTLAFRLRKANTRIRELEDNQTAHYGKSASSYELLKNSDVIKILGTMFLVFKTHGEEVNGGVQVDKKLLSLYGTEIYSIPEAKSETMFGLLKDLNLLQVQSDKFIIKELEQIRQIFIYYNTERHLPDDKKLNITEKCETLIGEMIREENLVFLKAAPVSKKDEENGLKFSHHYSLNSVLEKTKIDYSCLDDGRNISLFGEILEDKGQLFVETNFDRVQKLYPVIRFMNSLKKLTDK